MTGRTAVAWQVARGEGLYTAFISYRVFSEKVRFGRSETARLAAASRPLVSDGCRLLAAVFAPLLLVHRSSHPAPLHRSVSAPRWGFDRCPAVDHYMA